MWKKVLWTQMGIADGSGKMVVFSDILENPMEMSPPRKKWKGELYALSKIYQIKAEECCLKSNEYFCQMQVGGREVH